MSVVTSNSFESSQSLDLAKIKSGFRRRAKSFWITLIVMSILSACLVVLIPATYLSRSTILIEQQEIPQDLVRSTVTSYADQRIETITQRVMTSVNLWNIIKKYELYEDALKKDTREAVIDQMRHDDIKRNVISAEVVDPRSGRPTKATIAFQLSFEYENPQLAQKVANELTTLFLSENLKSRTQMAEQASSFLETEAEKLDAQVNQLEQELAQFKEDNFDSLPELTRLNLNLLDRTEQSLKDNRSQTSLVRERIIFLENELAKLDPEAPLIAHNGEAYLSSAARLKYAKQQLEQSQARYSDNHPDVLRLQKEIDGLLDIVPDQEAPKIKLGLYQRKLSELRQRYSDDHPSIVQLKGKIEMLEQIDADTNRKQIHLTADNPAYLQVKGQLETAQIELDGLRERQNTLQADLKEYEERITKSPKIEQAYQQLNRAYQSAVLKYSEVKAKQQEAKLGQSLESEQKGERFTLIEPALVPERAHSPNRVLLAVLGVILTLSASVGIVMLREMLDRSIKSRQDLLNAVGAPPLAVIPVISTRAELSNQSKRKWWFLFAIVIAAVVAMSLFHVLIKPLDVTWFVLLRKLGF